MLPRNLLDRMGVGLDLLVGHERDGPNFPSPMANLAMLLKNRQDISPKCGSFPGRRLCLRTKRQGEARQSDQKDDARKAVQQIPASAHRNVSQIMCGQSQWQSSQPAFEIAIGTEGQV